jgi:hypothetical protein
MKIKLFVTFIILLFASLSTNALRTVNTPKLSGRTKLIKGALVSKDDNRMDGFRLLFGGYKTLTDNEGFFTFPLESSPTKPLYILIGKGAIWEYDKSNTIRTLRQNQLKPYLFYVAKCHENNDEYTLSVTQEYLDGWNFNIPAERCLIVPINPSHVKSVETWKSPFDKRIIRFPKIVLKTEAELNSEKTNIRNEKKIRRIAQKSVLKSMEDSPFHESSTQVKKQVFNKQNRPVEISITH